MIYICISARNEERTAGVLLWKIRRVMSEFKRDYEAMNAVYKSCFPPGRLPARTCIGVTGLARDALVEIDMVARRP